MQTGRVFIVLIFAAVFMFSTCGKPELKQLSVQTSVRVEAAFFRSNCVLCHGAEGEGKEMNGRQIPSLRREEAWKKSDEELYNQIVNGGNGMPPFKYQMTEQQTRNMVGFIRDLQKENY